MLISAGLLVACGGDPTVAEPLGAQVPFEPSASGATPLGDVPWPSDLYLEDGHIGEVPGLSRVASISDSIQAGLSAMDGFGRSAGALFFVGSEVAVEPESLSREIPADLMVSPEPERTAFFADVDPDSDKFGALYPALAKYLPTLDCISVIPVPGVVLPPGVRHAAVITTSIHTADGRPLVASEKLAQIAALSPKERSSPAEVLYGDAIEALVATGAIAAPERAAALAVFTTSRQVEEMPVLRARLRDLPEPELVLDPAVASPYSVAIFGAFTTPSLDDWLGNPDKDENGVEWPGGDNPGGIAHDAIGAVASGAFVAPSLLDKDTEHFERDNSGEYVIADPNAMIPVTLVLPKSPPPASGYPVVINGHGLSNNRGSMLSVANDLAKAGFAMIGIDDVLHGARAGIKDEINNYKGPYSGPDGIPDELPLAASFFAGFSDFVAVRDNFRQTVLDQTSLVRLIQSSKLDLSPLSAATGGTLPVLDSTRIYWSGGSLGGIMGTMTVAIEPEIRAAALQVPGASFVQLITTSSAKVSPLVTTIASGTFGIEGEEALDEHHPVALLLAAVTEAGDPIAYAPHIMQSPITDRAPPDLLVTYAIYDEVLPNISTHALIRALGIPLAEPYLLDVPGIATIASPVSKNRGERTAAAVQYAPSNHGLGYGRYDTREFLPGVPFDSDPRFPKLPKSFQIEMPVREHAKELAGFFVSSNTGTANIEVTAPPIADFDADGALDADDANPEDPDIQ